MSTFNVRQLANDRALITGTDDAGEAQKTILSTLDYNTRKLNNSIKLAQDDFDRQVEAFYAPITKAAEAAGKVIEQDRDPDFFQVIQEESPGSEAKKEIIHRLPVETVILNLIEQGRTNRLIWIDNTIEVLQQVQPAAAAVTMQTPEESVSEGTTGEVPPTFREQF